jgi:beta-1,3-galactosyltransferase 1
MQEQQEHVNRSNTSVYYFKTNYWHPAKVRIISNTWSLCTDEQGANLDMFVFLWTRPSTFKLRQVIRETWGSRVTYPNMNVAFILGLSSDSAQNEKILEENQLHGDVIQGDFRDSYRNLSFKSLISWRWVKYNCMNVKYFLKIDDDVYPHTRKLLGHIKNVFSKKPPPPFSFSCSIWFASGAIRDKHSKYYVSEQEWPDPIFPYYCSGVAYLFTNDLPAALYNFSFTTKDFWIGK